MVIDIILLLFAIVGFWLGYTKGIVATLFSILTYVVAFLITLAFSPWLSRLLVKQFHMNHVMGLFLGTLLFFIVSFFLIKWLSKKVDTWLKKGKLSGANKILGGVVMMLVGIVFYSLILWLINNFGFINEKIKLASYSYDTLKVIITKASSLVLDLKPVFQRYWELIQESIKENETPASG